MFRVRLVRGSFDAKENFGVAVEMVLREARGYWKIPSIAVKRLAAGAVVVLVGLFLFRPLLNPGAELFTLGFMPFFMALLAAVLIPVGLFTRLLALRLFGMSAVSAEERELSRAEVSWACAQDG